MRRRNLQRVLDHTLVKRSIFILLFIFSIQTVSLAKQDSLSVSIQGREIRIARVFKDIQQQTGFIVFYNNNILNDQEKINVDFNHAGIKEALNYIIKGRGLDYIIRGRFILLKKSGEKNNPDHSVPAFQKEKSVRVDTTVEGIVKDESGQPLIGVSVSIKGSQKGTITNEEGRYSISVPDLNGSLVFSYVGYQKMELPLNGKLRMDVVMKAEVSSLNQLVVIGYGEVKKKDLTGSVVNVNMDDIRDEPVTSVDIALQGRVPGANIMATTGEPGAGTTIRIRGTRSITASNEPLIVVDGVIDAIDNLNDINPSDIATISVLKDASATAIYGSKGSNGVIMITTKHGKKGTPRITLKNTVGISQLPRQLDIMDAAQFAQYRNDYAFFSTTNNNANIGTTTPQSKYPYPDPFSKGEGTNWVKEITRIAPYHTHFLSLSGGGDKATYYASVSYDNNQGIIQKSGLSRITGRLNLDYQVLPWMKIGYKNNFNIRDEDKNLVTIGGANWWNAAIFLSPLIRTDANFNPLWYSGQKFNSPRAILDDGVINNIKRKGVTNNVYVEIKPVKNLKIRSQLNYFAYARHTFQYEPGILPAKEEGEGGEAYRGEYKSDHLMSQTTVNFIKEWGNDHHIDVTLGLIGEKSGSDNFTLSGQGYQSDEIKWNNMNAIPDKENYSAGTSNSKETSLSYLARFNYNYKHKYYVTVTGRRDGASNFALDKKWAFFPSAALKWTVSNEDFFKQIDWISEFSIRASAGRTGNDAISSYRSLSALGSTTNGYLFNESQPVAFYPSRLASENLSWEKTDMYNIATDISFLDRRVNITLEAYMSKTRDLLLNVQVPQHTGYTTRLANVGKTSNKGIEFSIQTRNITKPDFSWSSMFAISHNSQRVEDISTVDYVPVYTSRSTKYMMYGYKKGYPLNALWGFQYGGTWKSDEEIERNKITKAYISNSPAKYSPGSPRYYDINHDGVMNEDDLIYLGNADPYVYGGLQNTFDFKNLSVSIFFNYSLGGKIYNISEQWMAGGYLTNQYTYMLNGWHPVRNPESNIPGAGSATDIPSNRMVYDASFIRLKALSIGYRWDVGKLTNNILQDIQFTLSGENLLLWKKYNGFDPDVSSSGTSSTLRRADVGAYPKPRTAVFSVQIRY